MKIVDVKEGRRTDGEKSWYEIKVTFFDGSKFNVVTARGWRRGAAAKKMRRALRAVRLESPL